MTIDYFADTRLFVLQTAATAYVFCMTAEGVPVHLYWGTRLPRSMDYPTLPPDRQRSAQHAHHQDLIAEYPTMRGIQEVEPCLELVFADGTRDVRLAYVSHEITSGPNTTENLTVRLRDEFYPLEVVLEYQIAVNEDILRRRATLINTGDAPITLEQVLSGSVALPADQGHYRLTHLSGAHNMETQLERSPVNTGQKVLESRQMYTGHTCNPFFALDLLDAHGQGATESSGEVWYGALSWSGNWKAVIEQTRVPNRFTRVSAGINDFDFSWQLEGGQTFDTPWLVLGYTAEGFGHMSRNLHQYQRRYVLPAHAAQHLRPVLYNSWEAVMFGVNAQQQIALARKAAQLGVELFVVDDGWFGARHSDRAGLGDWTPNAAKFPAGLAPVIAEVNTLGMDFGLWVEPEMVNPDSDLYRAHPEWVYHFANRTQTPSRHQLILNLARTDVQTYIFETLDTLLAEHNIAYIKWDYNRAISEPGWPEMPREKQREIWVRHVTAFYAIVDGLREKHPTVLFEACAGGGGRADMGALSHFDHVWTSDNTDPYDRLSIQQGYSLVYAPKTMYCWVTDTNLNAADFSLRYRFHSSWMGSLGIGSDLNTWSDTEMAEATALVAEYKALRPIIQDGIFSRLTPLGVYDRMAVQYHAPQTGEGVILAFDCRLNFWQTHEWLRLRPVGLEKECLYQIDGDLAPGEPVVLSGQALESRGVLPHFTSHFASAVIRYRRVEEGALEAKGVR